MDKFKILAVLVTLFVALMGAGCKKANLFKLFFESPQTRKKALEIAPDVIEMGSKVLDEKSANNSSTKNPGKSTATKAGAVVAGATAGATGSALASKQSITKSDNNKVNRSSDDMLGNVKLGDSLSSVSQILGEPIKKPIKAKISCVMNINQWMLLMIQAS